MVGPAEKLGIDAGHRQRPHLARFGLGKYELAGQRGEGPAALGVGHGREVFLHQPQFAVARRGE